MRLKKDAADHAKTLKKQAIDENQKLRHMQQEEVKKRIQDQMRMNDQKMKKQREQRLRLAQQKRKEDLAQAQERKLKVKQIQEKLKREADARFDQQNLKFKNAVGALRKKDAANKARKERVQTATNKRKEATKRGFDAFSESKKAGIETKIKHSDRVYENFSAGKNPARVDQAAKAKERAAENEQKHEE